MTKRTQLVFVFYAVCLVVGIATGYFFDSKESTVLSTNSQPTEKVALIEKPLPIQIKVTRHAIKSQSSAYDSLIGAGVSVRDSFSIIETARKHHEIDKVRAGLEFAIEWSPIADEDRPGKITYELQPNRKLVIEYEQIPNIWVAEIKESPIEIEPVTFSGVVETTLWESAYKTGIDPNLISDLTDIFAWQIDFSREIRMYDQWRIVVEKKFTAGTHIGWGNILAAEYENNGETYTGIRYPRNSQKASYYMPDGSSLKRIFLKSPIKFARVSSRFQRKRFHPILKRSVPHNGVDYSARPGTPVMSVGNGRVRFSGRNGASGIMVKIRHNTTYETAYLHLSRIAKGVRKGVKIDQGQVIGYVGSTGRATGPHLHFAFFERGRFVDPLGRKFPSKDPIPRSKFTEFSAASKEVLQLLPDWNIAGKDKIKKNDVESI